MFRNFLKLFCIYVLLFAISGVTFAKADGDFKPNEKQTQVLQKLSEQLTAKRNVVWEFTQEDEVNGKQKGYTVVSQPGKMRVEYDEIPLRVVINDGTIMFQDTQQGSKSFVPASQVPLFQFLTQDKISFLGSDKIHLLDYKITSDGMSIITLKDATSPDSGVFTIYLNESEGGRMYRWSYSQKAFFIDVLLHSETVYPEGTIKDSIFATNRVTPIKREDYVKTDNN